MNCKNHSEVPAAGRCHGCAEAFCDACVVAVAGDTYCRDCKYMTVKTPPVLEDAFEPNPEARKAFNFGLVGLIFPIVSPWVIMRGTAARKAIEANPKLEGIGHAKAAVLLGASAAALGLLGLFMRMKHV